jgi:succinyl-diaminopimelate desuccinylase
MNDDIVSLTQRLVSIQSIPGNSKALAEILELVLSHLGSFTVERFEHSGVSSALVYAAPTRPEKFRVILNAHLDIIPGKEGQYTPRIEGGRLYGAGAMDMKASVACMSAVFSELARQSAYPLGLQLTTDEEIGGFNGTKHQIEEGVRADFVIAGEPTNFDIVNQTKGIVWARVFARGRSAHGAYPWRGDNAVWKMKQFLDAVQQEYPPLTQEAWATSVSIGSIATSNTALNKIPDDCVLGLDIRSIPQEAEGALERVRALLPAGVSLEVLAHEPALFTDAEHADVQLLRKTSAEILNKEVPLRGAHGSSDARHFAPVGGAAVEFGPIGDGIGSDDEWVDLDSLSQYTEILRTFLRQV